MFENLQHSITSSTLPLPARGCVWRWKRSHIHRRWWNCYETIWQERTPDNTVRLGFSNPQITAVGASETYRRTVCQLAANFWRHLLPLTSGHPLNRAKPTHLLLRETHLQRIKPVNRFPTAVISTKNPQDIQNLHEHAWKTWRSNQIMFNNTSQAWNWKLAYVLVSQKPNHSKDNVQISFLQSIESIFTRWTGSEVQKGNHLERYKIQASYNQWTPATLTWRKP